MKKAAIITVHVGENFGSNLQTIATCDCLKHIGVDPIVVNYIPPRVTIKRYLKDTFSIRNIKGIPGRLRYFPSFLKNKKIYDGYLAKHCKVSVPIYSEEDFAEACPQADYYITGSDQVWNYTWNEGVDSHYFFDGIDGTKIAFASSIGSEKLSENEIKAFKRYLPGYKAVSVRESQAVDALKKIGFRAKQLVDPTFMIDREGWKKYATKRIFDEPYILVYLPYNIVDKDLAYKSIRTIAQKKKLKIVTFAWGGRDDCYADITCKYSTPGDFLSLMLYADQVVTNSFHGTAFSINLNKEFWVYMPSGFSSRITSILSVTGLTDRILSGIITDNQIEQVIDYRLVNDIIKKERDISIAYLKNALDVK